jgi:cysteinyl-tRNA synthetase
VAALQQVEGGEAYPELDQLLYDLKSGFGTAMDDDLNISAALAAVFKAVKQLNRLMSEDAVCADQVPKILDGFRQVDSVLNIFHFGSAEPDREIADLLRRRDTARKARDWELADALRRELAARGVVVRDDKIHS